MLGGVGQLVADHHDQVAGALQVPDLARGHVAHRAEVAHGRADERLEDVGEQARLVHQQRARDRDRRRQRRHREVAAPDTLGRERHLDGVLGTGRDGKPEVLARPVLLALRLDLLAVHRHQLDGLARRDPELQRLDRGALQDHADALGGLVVVQPARDQVEVGRPTSPSSAASPAPAGRCARPAGGC